MIKVVVPAGQSVVVQLEGTDGEFKITYGKTKLTVFADMPDTKGRKGTIYEERFAVPAGAALEQPDTNAPVAPPTDNAASSVAQA